ncbi:MAG: WG repeat-containing protein [Flavobacteriales bacterium]|nr:WG repeat-containing protein [Flavobacteriales bacterium]
MNELAEDYKIASLHLLPYQQGELWGYIDDAGTVRIDAQYEFAEPFEGGQALVGKNKLVGTVNRSGTQVVPIEYDEVVDPVEKLMTVERDGRSGAVTFQENWSYR